MSILAKIAALLRKTVENGATPGEQDAAVAKARELVAKHSLDPKAFDWPPRRPAKSRLSPRSAKTVASKHGRKRRTRADEVIELLRRKNGATVEEMVKRFGIQPHSLRAVISVEGRKRGLKVERVGKAHYRAV